jgi:uncharacterized protein YjbJ (UPF0337 family)
MKQEAFMNWEQIEASWKQLKDKIVFRWGRLTDDNGKRVDLIGAETSRDAKAVARNRRPFAPTTTESGASFHSTLAVD